MPAEPVKTSQQPSGGTSATKRHRLSVVALINARAGACHKTALEMIQSRIEEAFARSGVDAEIGCVSGDDLISSAKAARARAERGEIDAVVVGGGDGSISCVASVLAGTSIPLGVLALGTLNHLAKDAGIPLDLEQAVETIAAGHSRLVDLAEVNGEIFINNSSIGFYPSMVIDRELRRRKHKLRKWIAVVPAFLHVLRRFRSRTLSVSAVGWTRSYRTPCLFVGNNEYATEPSELGRRRRLDGGELFVCVVKPLDVFGFLRLVLRLALGRPIRSSEIESLQVSQAEIGSNRASLPVALDGEVKLMHPPLRYHSRPRALRLLAPG